MNEPFSIVPPPELVEEWLCSDDYLWGPLEQKSITITTNRLQSVAAQAAQWGSDQELEACCELLTDKCFFGQATLLREWRRPKPPSLKVQAMEALREACEMANDRPPEGISNDQIDIIRCALNELPDN
jgi:hypothetical protein